MTRLSLLLGVLATVSLMGCAPEQEAPTTLRIATFNIEDIRTTDLHNTEHPRLKAAAALLQELRPDIVLINEIAYDQPGIPGYSDADGAGHNGQRFADAFLAVSQSDGLEPLRYRAFMAPSNTGEASGYDLNRDGEVVSAFPTVDSAGLDGAPVRQTPEGRAYGNDSWGFGTFPGQYAMALLVREDLRIMTDEARTFQTLAWSSMPDALRPMQPDVDAPWYLDDVWATFRLSSKSHWDVPVLLSNGTRIHLFASHPTPPVFDGPEKRNQRRNHDEIRFWHDYLNNEGYIVDDKGGRSGYASGAPFVILGDLNADPNEGAALNNPVGTWLFAHPLINGTFVPEASDAGQAQYPNLDADDTARWGQRADYVLPSMNLEVIHGGVVRPDTLIVSDHFPVWIDVVVPASVH